MTIFNVRYTPNGINVYNYDYGYDHMFISYTKIIEIKSESYSCYFNADNLKKICDILGTTDLVMRLYCEMKVALIIDEKTANQAIITTIRKYC